MPHDTDTDREDVAPCRLTVEPGDLFELALRVPADKRRKAIIAAMLAEADLKEET